jgi:hypothetical protein
VLPRYFERNLKVENARRVAAKPPPAEDIEPEASFTGRATIVDAARLRGIPAISPFMGGGAIAGTDPFRAAAARERERERQSS